MYVPGVSDRRTVEALQKHRNHVSVSVLSTSPHSLLISILSYYILRIAFINSLWMKVKLCNSNSCHITIFSYGSTPLPTKVPSWIQPTATIIVLRPGFESNCLPFYMDPSRNNWIAWFLSLAYWALCPWAYLSWTPFLFSEAPGSRHLLSSPRLENIWKLNTFRWTIYPKRYTIQTGIISEAQLGVQRHLFLKEPSESTQRARMLTIEMRWKLQNT